MRLIDADKLLEETRKDRDYAEKNGFLDMYYERQVLIDRIESQPTAYDVNKVIEELELHSFELGTDMIPVHYVRLNESIEIVKQGSVSDASDNVCEWKFEETNGIAWHCDDKCTTYNTQEEAEQRLKEMEGD